MWQKDPCGSFCPAAQQLCRHYCTLNIDTANKTDCPSKWLRHVQALLASVSQAQLIADVGVPQVRGGEVHSQHSCVERPSPSQPVRSYLRAALEVRLLEHHLGDELGRVSSVRPFSSVRELELCSRACSPPQPKALHSPAIGYQSTNLQRCQAKLWVNCRPLAGSSAR